MATSYTSNKKIGALDTASTPLAATNELVINQGGDILKTPLSAIEAKVFDAKTPATTTPAGTEVVVIRKTDNTISQVALSDIVPALNITTEKIADGAVIDAKIGTISSAGRVANTATTATSANTVNAIVARDGSGNFSAGTITATLAGSATGSAATLATGRTIALTGDVSGTTGTFNGSANVSAATTIANNAVTTAKIADASSTTTGVTNSKLRHSAALSVIGRGSNSGGFVADIAAASDHHVLRRSGTSLGFGQIATDGIADSAVTQVKMGNITATGGTAARSLADRFADVVNAKDFGAVGDGVANDSPAIQAAVTFCSENKKPLYVPNGTYRLATRVQLNDTAAPYVNMMGAGTSETIFTVNGAENSSGAFYFYKNGSQLSAKISDISIRAIAQSGSCGTALHIEENQGGAASIAGVSLRNIFITSPDIVTSTGGVNDIATPAYWTRGVVVKNSPRPVLTNVVVGNPSQRFATEPDDTDVEISQNENATNSKFGVLFKDDSVDYLGNYGIDVSDCYSPLIDSCMARHYKVGFYAFSDARRVEGGRFINCVAVAVKDGIRIDAATARGVEPSLTILGGHMNYRDNGVYIRKRKQIYIERILFYHSNPFQGDANYGQRAEDSEGTAYDIRLEQCHDAKILNNRMERSSTSNRNGIRMTNWDAGGGRQPDLRVLGNSFDGRFSAGVRLDAVPSKEQYVEPEIGINFWGFGVGEQIKFGSAASGIKRAPHVAQLMTDRFTPVVVGGSMVNLDAVISPDQCFFSRIGNTVSAFGRFSINPTATGTACQFDIEAPILLTFPIQDLVAGSSYTILFVGGSDFTTVGAANNNVGTVFTATGPNTTQLSGGGLATRNTSLLSVDDGAGFIVHCGSGSSPVNAFGQVFPSGTGKIRFRFLPHGQPATNPAATFYYFNFSYELK
jgi:hypothetical protein